MSTPPKKEYVVVLLEQRDAFKKRKEFEKERAIIEAKAARERRAQERAILRARRKRERLACATWASTNKDRIDTVLDELDKAFDAVEGSGMIGEDDVSIVQWLDNAYGSLASAMTPDQRACIDITRSGADEILAKKLNDLILLAERESDHLCEEQLRHINAARGDLVILAEAIEKASIGIYEPP